MKSGVTLEDLSGVWSAAPTPFTDDMKVDIESVNRMVDHHLRLGVKGLFLAGTNGEGPWMPDEERHVLVRAAVKRANGRMPIAIQVTDNSAARILDNIHSAKEDGADIAVIAPPYFLLNATPNRILEMYLEAIRQSLLPVGIYDRGNRSSVVVPDAVLKRIYAEGNVILVKDSSSDPRRREIALAARRKRPELRLMSGNEFKCFEYLEWGYDGLILGGGVFNGYLAKLVVEAVAAGDLALAQRLQKRMNRIMYAVYGGRKIRCWLSGEKKLLVEMGIFRTWKNFLHYPLTESCQKAIGRVLERDLDVLMPGEEKKRWLKEVMRRRASDNEYFHRDFHGALSAGIEYLDQSCGADAVRQYLHQFTTSFYVPLTGALKKRGLIALKEHFEKVYEREGSNIRALLSEDELVIKIETSPAVSHMRRRGYHVARLFHETTKTVNEALCEGTPFSAQLLEYDEQTGRAVVRFYRR